MTGKNPQQTGKNPSIHRESAANTTDHSNCCTDVEHDIEEKIHNIEEKIHSFSATVKQTAHITSTNGSEVLNYTRLWNYASGLAFATWRLHVILHTRNMLVVGF